MRIRAALIDMDGTIFDSKIDWLRLREKIQIPWDGRAILAQLREVPANVRESGLALLHEAERIGAETGDVIEGTHELLDLLHRYGVRCALVTNNSRRSADTVLRRSGLTFDVVLTRDDVPTKPEPEGFHRALAELSVRADEAVAVGDAHLDVLAAQRAGVGMMILVASPTWMNEHIPADAKYERACDLGEVREILTQHFAGAV